MAIKQIVPIFITLQGDGAASVFTFALQNLYQAAVGGSIPFGSAGVPPSGAVATDPPVPVTSVTVDANGNITITLTSPLGVGVEETFEIDLTYLSGSAVSSSPTQTTNVTIVGSSSVTVSGTVASNITEIGGSALALGQATMANSIPVVLASNQSTIPVSLTSTTITGTVAVTQSTSPWVVSGTVTANAGTGNFTVVQSTAANLNATVVGTGTFAVQAAQSGTWNIGTLTTITNPVTVVGDSASGAANAGNPVKTGGVFNTAQPTVTNGQTVDSQSTARGAAIVATGVDTFNVTVNAALPAGTNVIGHVITDTGSTTVVTGTVAVTQSGSWTNTVTQATAANLNATVVGTGTFAVQAAQSGTWTVQQGGAPWSQVGTLTHNNAAPAANNVGVLPAVASSAAPTYNAGDQVLLSTDLSGNLRVAGSLTVSDADTVGTPGTLNANNATATVTTTGQGGVGVLIAAGTLAATVVPEISYDGGTTWVASVFFDPTANTTSANLVFTNPNAATTRTILIDGGVSNVRVRVSAFTSGTATATLRSTFNAGGQYVNQGGTWNVGVTGTVAVTQSTSPWVVSGTVTANAGTGNFTVVQSTAASLNATVVGTGTFAVQAAQSGTWTVQQGGAPWSQNLTQVAGTSLGATAVTNFGTAPAAAAVPGVNASLFAGTTGITATGSSLNVNVTNTVPVTLTSTTITGTVAVTQSTSPWTVQGDSASGAANAGNPVKGGGVFNTTQPTVTNGQTVDQQSTARGGLIVATGVDNFVVSSITGTVTISGTVTANQGGAPWSQNLTQVAGTTLGATAVTNFGTAPAAAAVPGVNASLFAGTTGITATGSSLNVDVTNTVAVTLTSTTITGTVAVTQSTSPWVDNVTQWASTALGTPQTFGTAPTGVVIGTSSDLYVAGTRASSNQTTTAAGVMDVNIVGSLGATNSVTNGTFIEITDGTTKAAVVSATAALKTDLSSVKGTATATAASGVQKVGIVGNANATLDSANTAATAPTNALLTSAMYNSTVPALTNGQAVAAECDTAGSLYGNPEGRKQTYRVGVVGFTPIASSTAPSISMTGSATKTIRITRIRMSITAATGGATDISLKRYSALSGGTANSQSTNIAKMDSNNAAQTAVVNQWSAAATTTTAAGIVNAECYEIVTAAVSVLPGVIEWTFGDKQGQSLVLRGTSEFAGFCITSVGTTPVADCWVEWTEE